MAEAKINFQPTRAGAQSAKRGKIKLAVNESLSKVNEV